MSPMCLSPVSRKAPEPFAPVLSFNELLQLTSFLRRQLDDLDGVVIDDVATAALRCVKLHERRRGVRIRLDAHAETVDPSVGRAEVTESTRQASGGRRREVLREANRVAQQGGRLTDCDARDPQRS